MKVAMAATAEALKERLELVFEWFQGMVNPATGRLEYLYLPETDSFIRGYCPIRDLGSVWDVEVLGTFLGRHELRRMIKKSLRHYEDYLARRNGCLMLDSVRLQEPSSIAHSAFLLLAMLNAPDAPPDLLQSNPAIARLAEGILRQQRRDGSYRVYFEDLPDQGEELYAGEAMLALVEFFRHSSDQRFLGSVARGLAYYDTHYFGSGCVGKDILIFFANWQSQAARALHACTRDEQIRGTVADYVFRMHDQIIDSGFYERVSRQPARQISVEVACALEGLNEAYAIAKDIGDERASLYSECICTGLEYLLNLQCIAGCTSKERGGFGLSFEERAQRIDITGHAASAFMKSIENGIRSQELPRF